MRIGGSFGRRLAVDYVRHGGAIAKQVPNTPVKMMWTREEDMAQGRFHPVTQCRIRAALDAQGNVDGDAYADIRPVDHRHLCARRS